MPKQLAPLVMLSVSSAKRGKTERGTAKVFGRKKRLESLAQVYIEDIHVIDAFFVESHNVILEYLY